ncbi:MAG TPA: hypothetical protein H9713_03545 [Candidatus Mediterraneibacter surreyensis]|nr:hypothetical protein [Candidatus Mediterraneibacter surreyensis]
MKHKPYIDQEYPTTNREYKDGLFRLVFQKKEDLLSLYNAVNGSNYSNPAELEVNTLGNVLYLTKKNDISFLISGMMNLYEHQSTFNPNMPVRGLMYLAKLYEKYIIKNKIDIYTSTPKKLPFPQYFVFYNGTSAEPDQFILKLSELFETPASSKAPCLECIAIMLNINYGHNKELMEKCKRLKEYAVFVDAVRRELSADTPLDQAVSRAVDNCISKNILTDILTDQKAEVIQMILETYDKELHDKTLRSEGYETGKAEGYKTGKAEGISSERENGILQLLSTLQELNISRQDAHIKLKEKYSLSKEEAEKYLDKYWKGL